MKAVKTLKRNLKKGSLFRRYFFSIFIMVMVAMITLGFVMIFFISGQWWNDKIDNLTRNTQDIVAVVTEHYDSVANDDKSYVKIISNTLDSISGATDSDFFITDTDGNVILCPHCGNGKAVSDCKYHGTLKVPEKYMVRALKNGFSDYATDDIFGLGNFIVAVPINVDGEDVGAVFAVEDAITGLLPYILSILRIFTITSFAITIASLIIIYVLSKSIITPISEMKEITNLFAKGEFEHRANENYKDDYINEFAKALNKMAYELSIDEEAQKSFVANVSHELKTPMTTIGGFIDGILDGTIPQSSQKEYLSIVSNEVKRLSRMVVSMLNLSKIESGDVSLAYVKYDIASQIFDTLLSFEKRIDEKHIEIEGFENMGSVPIYADRDLIQQVIYNLVDNAVKFTPDGEKISFFAAATDEKTVVSIRNYGKSVSTEEISRIFERFYKVDKSRSYDVKGVGLGLYIVKTIINMHGGEITASSVEGSYTEFSFEIPNER